MCCKSLKYYLSLVGATLIPELCYFLLLLLLFLLLFKLHLSRLCQNATATATKDHIWSPGVTVESISQYLFVFSKLFL